MHDYVFETLITFPFSNMCIADICPLDINSLAVVENEYFNSVFIVHDRDTISELIQRKGSDYELSFPSSIASLNQFLFVADTGNHCIRKFTINGEYLSCWGQYGMGIRDFRYPSCIVADEAKHLIVADSENVRFHVYDVDGNMKRMIAPSFLAKGWISGVYASRDRLLFSESYTNAIYEISYDGHLISSIGKRGCNSGEFVSPMRITRDTIDTIFVTDTGNSRLQIFEMMKLNSRIDSIVDLPCRPHAISSDNRFVYTDCGNRILCTSLS